MKAIKAILAALAISAGSLATQSLFAMPVYRYEWWWETSTIIRLPELGEEASGYIDFREPYGTEVPIPQAIADIWVRGFNGVDTFLNGGFEEFSPPIPAPIISGLQDSETAGIISWNESRILGGFWSITHFEGPANIRIRDFAIETFFPLQYDSNESMLSGSWHFSGVVENPKVPEAGSFTTLAAMSLVALVMFRRTVMI